MEVQTQSPGIINFSLDTQPIVPVSPAEIPSVFHSTSIDLLSASLGTRILSISDEWFAAASNLISPHQPIRKPNTFTYAGAWYDGWETRRHNPAEFDYVVFGLGVSSGRVRGIEIDTAFFNGNHAPEVSVQAARVTSADTSNPDVSVQAPSFEWETILPRQECGPDCVQAWKLPVETSEHTHIRLQMWPDGGIARFRLWGTVVPVFVADAAAEMDLAAAVNGGVCTGVSDQHFGRGGNLTLPGRGVDMGDGWETKRSRGEHIDWAIIRLGVAGYIDRVVVDTAHFRGNFPQKIQLFAAYVEPAEHISAGDHDRWVELLAPTPIGPDEEHEYGREMLSQTSAKPYSHVKLVIIPDGGVKRLRVFGRRS